MTYPHEQPRLCEHDSCLRDALDGRALCAECTFAYPWIRNVKDHTTVCPACSRFPFKADAPLWGPPEPVSPEVAAELQKAIDSVNGLEFCPLCHCANIDRADTCKNKHCPCK